MNKEKLSIEETEAERQVRRAEEDKRSDDNKNRYEKEERERYDRFKQIVEISKEAGLDCPEGYLAGHYIRFDTKSEALAFQSLCKERNLSVEIIEPDPRKKLFNFFRVVLE